jgi:hypothetical protein
VVFDFFGGEFCGFADVSCFEFYWFSGAIYWQFFGLFAPPILL